MKKHLLSTTGLMFLLFWPIQAQETGSPVETIFGTPPVAERFTSVSETTYLDNLSRRGFKLDTQGLLVESLDASMVYADHNSSVGFNPASVIKIATSFAALTAIGPDYQFETAFLLDGTVNKKTRTLKGDLILQATGDPMLAPTDVTRLLRQVINSGVAQVDGDLIVTGPFTYGPYFTTERALKAFATTLRKMGIRVTGKTKTGEIRGVKVATHFSSSLRDILFYQNAHSSNSIADRLGEVIGGPNAVERFLVEAVGIPEGEVSVSHASGLGYNRITPRGTIQLLREMAFWLNLHAMEPQDIMPVAGVDPGTLRTRFTSLDYRGAVVGKTGTLPATDGGVSTLAGILYTRERGPLLFAIFNTKGPVMTYRRLQDSLLKDFLAECGGIPEISASLRRSNN